MTKIFFIFLSFSIFIWSIIRIIKKKKNPVYNGAMAATFGIATWINISPYIAKLIKSIIQ